jgi:hypothetical protein
MHGTLALHVYGSEAEDELGLAHNSPLGMLIGCTAEEAVGALARAQAGDYSDFETVLASPSPRLGPPAAGGGPVEALLLPDGSPAFDARTREYLRAARSARPAATAPWRTSTCPECRQEVTGDGAERRPDGTVGHVTALGAVLLGCLGYFVVNPAALCLPADNWQDWRDPAAAGPAEDRWFVVVVREPDGTLTGLSRRQDGPAGEPFAGPWAALTGEEAAGLADAYNADEREGGTAEAAELFRFAQDPGWPEEFA